MRVLGVAILASIAALMPAGTWADSVLHARVSFDAGGSMVKGAEDSDWSHAVVNTLVLPGDTLWVDQGGTSEIEFSGGSFLRMADTSKAEVTTIAPTPTVRGWEGSFYVHRLSRASGDFVFITPACTVQVDQDTAVRIDIVNQGATVSVRWGKATVNTDVGSPVYVSSGERVWVDPGLLPSEPVPFDRSEEDGFDVWNRERTEQLVNGYKSVPEAVVTEPVIGTSDLGTYGEWVSVDDRQYWRPTVVTNYVPYRYGSWSYTPSIGYCWVDNYPFSYITSHYGRWNYFPSYGWCWGYDPVWSPAWVATVRCGDYLVWSPVDYYYRPCYSASSAYFSIGGVSYSAFACSYAPISHVGFGSRYVYGVNSDISNYIFNNIGDVYIWNINIGDSPHVRVPYDRPLDQVRIYNPRRSIRGPETFGADTVLASQRVRRLESSVGRDAFSALDRTGRAGVRTDAASQERVARTRNVRVTQDSPSYTRASSRNPEDAAVAANRTLRVPRSRDIATSEELVGGRGTRSAGTSPERGAQAMREAAERSSRTTTSPRGLSTESGRTPVEGRTVRGERTPDSGSGTATARTRTPSGSENVRGRTPAGDRGSVTRVPTGESIERSPLRGPSVRTTPEATRRVEPRRSTSEVTRTPVRSGPPSMSTPDRERMTTPSTRESPPRTTRVERTPTRSGPPQMSAPDRSLSSSSEIRRPRVITTAPDRSSVQRTAPRTTERPRSVESPRAMEAPRAPDRSIVRQSSPRVEIPRSAPERSYSAPEFSRPRAPEPSRSIERSAPSVRYEAPRVEHSAPSISRPEPRMSAPSPSHSVQHSAPSFSRPESSGGGRSSVSESPRGGGDGGGRSVRGR
ncbi:MAG: hypothetical protein HYV26_17575 [Candidatus Hydrogenedentes bacterium]|nr:hypothetical protein [Candidatus Hydrogenedentota bacterium]